MKSRGIDRRLLLQLGSVGAGLGITGALAVAVAKEKEKAVDKSRPTKFQIACMTLPYSAFPLQRSLDRPQVGRLPLCRLGHEPQGRGRQISTCPGI